MAKRFIFVIQVLKIQSVSKIRTVETLLVTGRDIENPSQIVSLVCSGVADISSTINYKQQANTTPKMENEEAPPIKVGKQVFKYDGTT